MSDVVPPGGERPVADEPWPVAAAPAPHTPLRLPGVPDEVPSGVAAPADWRTMTDGTALSPPGYMSAGARHAATAQHLDQFGLAACIVAVVGLLQLFLVVVPVLLLLAVALGLSGRRYVRLDPDSVRAPLLSTIGVALGVAGLFVGIALTLLEYA